MGGLKITVSVEVRVGHAPFCFYRNKTALCSFQGRVASNHS